MKNLKTFENYSENIEEENWLENKTDEELLDMYKTLKYNLEDVPYGVRDAAMARATIRNQMNPIIKEINKREIIK